MDEEVTLKSKLRSQHIPVILTHYKLEITRTQKLAVKTQSEDNSRELRLELGLSVSQLALLQRKKQTS